MPQKQSEKEVSISTAMYATTNSEVAATTSYIPAIDNFKPSFSTSSRSTTNETFNPIESLVGNVTSSDTNLIDLTERAKDNIAKSNESVTNADSSSTVPPLTVEPSRLDKLRAFQRTIQDQLRMVNNRIFDLETIYLEDTLHGNIIKGWEMDGRTAPLYRSRSIIEDKERLFSYSSYRYQQDRRLDPDLYVPANERLPRLSATASTNNNANNNIQKQRKSTASATTAALNNNSNNSNPNKKRKTNEFIDEQQSYHVWNGLEDY